MKRALLLMLPLVLAACAEERLTPAPGQAPGWPTQDPPRPSYAPLPFKDTYLPVNPVQTLPAVPPGQNVPYAVPHGALPVPAAAPMPAPAPVAAAPVSTASPTEAPPTTPAPRAAVSADGVPPGACHKIPPVNFEGKQTSTVCQQPGGTWVYVPD